MFNLLCLSGSVLRHRTGKCANTSLCQDSISCLSACNVRVRDTSVGIFYTSIAYAILMPHGTKMHIKASHQSPLLLLFWIVVVYVGMLDFLDFVLSRCMTEIIPQSFASNTFVLNDYCGRRCWYVHLCTCLMLAVIFKRNATWLILPVVICLSQRLSHACVSMN